MIKLNGVEVKVTIFPDGTSQVWKLHDSALSPEDEEHEVYWEFESEAEFIHVAQLKNLLDSRGEASYLFLPYLPYGRQDKRVSNETTFALHTFSELLNVLNFGSVQILDPHSNPYNRIHGAISLDATPYIDRALARSEPDVVCFPDSGALKRYELAIPEEIPLISAYKIRDQLTGEISRYGFTVPDPKSPNLVIPPDLAGKTVLIVDDICDGGATFKLCAEKLIEAGAKDVHLYVTHGLFTKGLQTLRDSGINRIFTRKGEINE